MPALTLSRFVNVCAHVQTCCSTLNLSQSVSVSQLRVCAACDAALSPRIADSPSRWRTIGVSATMRSRIRFKGWAAAAAADRRSVHLVRRQVCAHVGARAHANDVRRRLPLKLSHSHTRVWSRRHARPAAIRSTAAIFTTTTAWRCTARSRGASFRSVRGRILLQTHDLVL